MISGEVSLNFGVNSQPRSDSLLLDGRPPAFSSTAERPRTPHLPSQLKSVDKFSKRRN